MLSYIYCSIISTEASILQRRLAEYIRLNQGEWKIRGSGQWKPQRQKPLKGEDKRMQEPSGSSPGKRKAGHRCNRFLVLKKKVPAAKYKSKPQWDTTSHQWEWWKLTRQETTNVGEDVEEGEPSCIVGGNMNWCSHSGKLWRFFKELKIDLPYDPAIALLGIYPKETL